MSILEIERIESEPVTVLVAVLLDARLTIGDDLVLMRGGERIATAMVMGILPNASSGLKAFDDARRGDRIKVVIRTNPRSVELDPEVVVLKE